jgi:signal transduction histidine kinase
MQFDLVTRNETCYAIFSEFIEPRLSLIYYSHLPTAIIAVFIGLFVFFKSKETLPGKTLLSVAVSFAFWSVLDLVTWISYDTRWTMLAWSMLGLLYGVIYVASLYFSYVFFDKKDVSFSVKLVFLALLLPILVLTPTYFNLETFDIVNCEAVEGRWFTAYYHLLGFFVFAWIAVLAFSRYRRAKSLSARRQILLFALGIEFFLLAFFVAGYLASLLENYNLLIYSLFGMPVFMGFLAYLIVQYEAFDIKLLRAQALIVALVLLIGAQFFFIKAKTNYFLNGLTFMLVILFGTSLIRSVKRDTERNRELQELTDRLAAANDKLHKLDKAKSEFISIASHQLRTPLTAIKGYVSLLIEGSYGRVEGEAADAMNKVYVATERLINLVENLLNISRIEAGRMQYRFEDLHVEDILAELYDTFVLTARNKSLSFVLNLPPQPLQALPLDRQKIQEALSNLIDNAIKYTDKGGVTVSAEDRDDCVRVTVQDTGIGVPASEIPHLFVKFSRGKDINRLHANGTGLGLYVVKNIVDAHGGRIWIESDGEGKGSRFIIELSKEHREGGI